MWKLSRHPSDWPTGSGLPFCRAQHGSGPPDRCCTVLPASGRDHCRLLFFGMPPATVVTAARLAFFPTWRQQGTGWDRGAGSAIPCRWAGACPGPDAAVATPHPAACICPARRSRPSHTPRPTCSSCCAMCLEKRMGSMMTPASLSTAGRVRLRKDTSARSERASYPR